MLTSYSTSVAKRKWLNPTLSGTFISMHIIMLYSCLVLLFTGLHVTSFGQRDTRNTTRVDIVERITRNNLRPPQRKQVDEYRNSVNRNLLLSRKPYDPYITINFNPKYLPPPPVRVYLGKRTTTDADDYVLLVIHCTKFDTTINRGEVLHYTDDTGNSGPGSKPGEGAVWTSISVSRGSETTDKVTYTPVTKKVVQQYIDNFQTVIEKKKSPRRYPVCFVIQRKKRKEDRIRLQPIVVTKRTTPANSSGQQRINELKRFIFQDLDTYEFQDADGNGDLCCKTPPETGNSAKQNNQ